MDVYEVQIIRYPSKGQVFTTTMPFDTYADALEYAKIERPYKFRAKIIHKYEVEEVMLDEMSVQRLQ